MLEYTNLPKNITEYPNSFERQGAFPLERYSVFYNYDEAEGYAYSDPVAYVGQPIAVVDESVVYYLIGPDKGLIRFGTRLEIDKLDARISEIEKFFALEDGESLKDTLDQLIELQKWIEEHLGDFNSFKNEINENLALEKEAREKKDQELSEAIVNEQVRATEAEEELRTAIAKNAGQIEVEQSAREEADTGLARDISTEKSTRQSQVSELQTALNEEIGRATNEERALSQNLVDTTGQIYNTLNTRFSQEATERTEAIDALETDTKRKLEAETTAREESDELLLTKISEESTERKDEAEVLRSALFSEIETARAQESELSKKIAAEERTRASEDVSIMVSLNNEKQERQQEDNRILGIIGDVGNSTVASLLSGLSQQMVSTDDKLREDLVAETDRAIAEEQKLVESLNKETSRLDILIGLDGEKSARTIANEELAAQLLSGKADADFKTLQQLAAWLEDHPEDVAAINAAIALNAENIAKEENRAKKVENSLEAALNEEIQLREAQINGLNFSTKEEVNRAKEAERLLDDRITAEKSRAQAAEALIVADLNKIYNPEGNTDEGGNKIPSGYLPTEIADRQAADAILQGNIDAIYIAASNDNEHSGYLANEIERALQAEQNIRDSFNEYENTIGFVKTGEKSLVEVFNELLETEAVTREENDQQLQNHIDAIYKETTEKTTDENGEEVEVTTYSGILANEINRAQTAEAEIFTEMNVRVQATTNQTEGAFLRLRSGKGVWESIPYAEGQLF